MKNNNNVFLEMLYGKPIERSMRQVTEAYNDVFNCDSENVRIVAEDLIRLTGYASTGVNPEQTIQYFTTGLTTVIQHMINTLNREFFIDEVDLNDTDENSADKYSMNEVR